MREAVNPVTNPIVIPEDAYPYLQMQRGAIADMAENREKWLEAYLDMIIGEFTCIESHLPPSVDTVLDIGAGMGGIDVLLARHYGDRVRFTLLDGIADLPFVQSHARTFSNADVAREFLRLNGVKRVDFVDANDPSSRPRWYYDLIVSFKAWCFHIEPARYIELVKSRAATGAKIIVDVRANKPEWVEELSAAFTSRGVIYAGAKFQTMLFEA